MNETSEVLNSSKAVPVISVIGIGGAGSNMVTQLARSGLGVTCIAANTDFQALAHCGGVQILPLGKSVTAGLSAGGDPKLGRMAAEAEEEQLRQVFQGADIVFLMAGLGNGTGSGAAPIVARAAKAAGALVLGIVAMPFEFEGSRHHRQAILGLARLRNEADAVICLPNQPILKLGDGKLTAVELFQTANEMLAEAVRGIWRLLVLPGLVNLDFAALRSVIGGKHAASCLVAAEAPGDNRAFEVWDRLNRQPAMIGGQVLAEADAVLVSIIGGEDLIGAEIEWLMAQITSQAKDARLLMGAVSDTAFNGRLAVTLIASQFGEIPEETAVPAIAVAPHESTIKTPALPELGMQILNQPTPRPRPRFVPPPPVVSPEKAQQMYRRQSGRTRRKKEAALQGLLPLEIVSKGRFEKSEPTIYDGEDLDVPTYIRRGVVLN